MSYILDALRRADAERERDPARGIHARPGAGVPLQARARVPGWAWPAGACVVLAAAGLSFWQRPAAQPEPPAVPAPAAVSAAPEPPPAPAPAPAAVVPVAAAVLPPPPVVVEPPRPAPPQVAVAAPTARPPASAAAPRREAAKPVAVAPETAAPASAPVAAADRIYNVAELPPDVQGQLPKLAITGGVHSDNAAQRLLIVAGQVVNEGAELAPGVVLEQIRPRTAVLRFRGYRYSVGF